MNGTPNHPSSERLQELVEGILGRPDRAVLDAHLATCVRCQAEVDELRSLFELLSDLPELAPSPAFANRVMAHVRIPRPAFAWADAWIERVTPRTTRAWAFASALLALPLVGLSAVAWWLVSQPGVNAQGLWLVVTGLARNSFAAGMQWVVPRLASSSLAGWGSSAMEVLDSVGRAQIGLALVMFATFTAASIWVLYKNLFRTEARSTDYASFVF